MTGSITLDPVLQTTWRVGLCLLLLHASQHKLRDFAAFRSALANYHLLPERGATPAAALLAGAELALGLALLVPVTAPAAACATAGLLALYSGAVGLNLLRGRREIDCGCAGPAARRPLGAGLLVRNAIAILLALACALPTGGRALLWLDGITIAAGVAVLVLVYAAVEEILASAPRLREGRERQWSTR